MAKSLHSDYFDAEYFDERFRGLSKPQQWAMLDLLERWAQGDGPWSDEESLHWFRARAMTYEACAGRA